MQKHKSTIKRILAYIGHYKWGVLASLVLAAITVAATLYLPVLIGYAVTASFPQVMWISQN